MVVRPCRRRRGRPPRVVLAPWSCSRRAATMGSTLRSAGYSILPGPGWGSVQEKGSGAGFLSGFPPSLRRVAPLLGNTGRGHGGGLLRRAARGRDHLRHVVLDKPHHQLLQQVRTPCHMLPGQVTAHATPTPDRWLLGTTDFRFPLTYTTTNKIIGWFLALTVLSVSVLTGKGKFPPAARLRAQFKRPMIHIHGVFTVRDTCLPRTSHWQPYTPVTSAPVPCPHNAHPICAE
jgi:hypothetical protein